MQQQSSLSMMEGHNDNQTNKNNEGGAGPIADEHAGYGHLLRKGSSADAVTAGGAGETADDGRRYYHELKNNQEYIDQKQMNASKRNSLSKG